MRNKKSHKKFLLLLLSNLIILLLIGVLVEGCLRFFGIPFKGKESPSENAIAQFSEVFGWTYIPNISKTLKYGEHIRNVYFDKNGIRVPYPEFQFDHRRPSVLFIGGSYTMGHGLSYEESFIGQFGALNGVPYQMVNLGVQGYGSDQSFLALKKYLKKFNQKVVFYTFNSNHIRRNGNYDRRVLVPNSRFLGTKPLFALNREKKLYLAKKPLLYKDYIHSYLIDLLKIRVGNRLGVFPPYPEELTKAIIREMNKYCIENEVHFVMLNWSHYNNFKDLNIEIIDTTENAPSDWDHMTIPGDGHPNAKASGYVAQMLFQYFQRKNLL